MIQMHDDALKLIMEAEASFVGERPWKAFGFVQRFLWFPSKFLAQGITRKVTGIYVGLLSWAFGSFALMILGTSIAVGTIASPGAVSEVVILGSAFVALILVVFSLPSAAGLIEVDRSTASFVREYLALEGTSAKAVELLKESVKPIERRVRNRVVKLKWLVGLLWARSVYLFAKWVEMPGAKPAQVDSQAFMYAGCLAAVFIAYLMVWGYESSLDALFEAIDLGCNERCIELERQSVQ
jgi:hypothetical protein